MKVALIVIYNHRYDKNIDIIETLYKNRFSNIYHLVPFYTGKKDNVIAVYENSLYFQGYVAQGLKSYFREEYKHYFFVADDMILNPDINENNYSDFFGLKDNSSFISEFFSLYKKDWYWSHAIDAFTFQLTKRKVEAVKELPTFNEAEKKLLQNKAIDRVLKDEEPLKWEHLNGKPSLNLLRKEGRKRFSDWLRNTIRGRRYSLSYPLVGSYADIFIVSSDNIKQFCHYCGVFAALDLFVEIALPTALALSAESVITEKELQYKGKPLWKEEEYELLLPYKSNLKLLLEKFPENVLHIHPIKLSQWDCSFLNQEIEDKVL